MPKLLVRRAVGSHRVMNAHHAGRRLRGRRNRGRPAGSGPPDAPAAGAATRRRRQAATIHPSFPPRGPSPGQGSIRRVASAGAPAAWRRRWALRGPLAAPAAGRRRVRPDRHWFDRYTHDRFRRLRGACMLDRVGGQLRDEEPGDFDPLVGEAPPLEDADGVNVGPRRRRWGGGEGQFAVLGWARVVTVLQEVLGEDLHGAVVLEGDVPDELGRRHEVDVQESVDAVGSAADLHLGGLVVDAAVGPDASVGVGW